MSQTRARYTQRRLGTCEASPSWNLLLTVIFKDWRPTGCRRADRGSSRPRVVGFETPERVERVSYLRRRGFTPSQIARMA